MADTAAPQQPQSKDLGAVPEPGQVARALAESEAICQAHGARLTPIRRQVLEALHAASRPLGAYELAEILAPRGRPMAPITIYRALDFLIQQGLAHRLASQNAYIASPDGARRGAATAFLICEDCSCVQPMLSAELAGTLAGLMDREGFQPKSRAFELTGLCAHCQQAH